MKPVRNLVVLFLGLLLILLTSPLAPGENLSPKQLYLKASNCFNKADYVNALEIFIELVEGYPQSTLAPPSQYQIAEIYIDKLKYTEQGIRELKRFLSLYPSDTLAPKVYYELTKRLYESQNYKEALSIAKEALKKIDPHSTYRQKIDYLVPSCLFEVSKSYFDNKKYPIAAEGFQKILTDYPDTKEAKTSLLFLGHCYSSLGKWKEAEKLYNEFLKRYPFSKISAEDYLQIGKTFQKLEQKRRAFLLFDRILKEYPESISVKEAKEMMKQCFFTKFTTPIRFGSYGPLVQDENYLWSGTGSWLSCYDKRTGNWKVYTYEDGVPESDRITTLLKEGDDLWIGTWGGGIAKLDTKINAITTFNTSDGIVSNDVWSISSNENYVWIGDGKNISQYDKKLKKWAVLPVPDDFPGSISLASNERFLFCSGDQTAKNNSIAKYDILEKKWEFLKEDFGRAYPRRPLAVDEKDLWVGHGGVWNEKNSEWEVKRGVVKYNLKDGSTTIYSSQNTGCEGLSDNSISDIKITKNFVYISSSSVYRYSKKDGTWKRYYQSGSDSIAADNDYIYSNNFGFWKTNLETGKREQIFYLIDSPPVDIQAILADRNDVWVCSRLEGIRRYSKKTNKWKAYGEKDGVPTDSWTWKIAKIGNEILVGTKYGIIKYDPNSNKWIEPAEYKQLKEKGVTNICNDGKYLWFSLYNEGVARYDKTRKAWKFFPIQNGLFKNVIYWERDEKYIWAACGSYDDVALCRFDKKKQSWEVFRMFKWTETYHPQFRAIGVDDNNLWLIIDTNESSVGYIIERYDKKNNRWLTYKTDFPDASTQDITVDKDYVWFFAAGKARCYDKKTGTWIPFPWYEMTANFCGPTDSDGDYLWVGAPSQGVIRFDKKLWFEYNNIFPSK